MQTGWLAPNGDFYPCAVFDHIGIAEDIISKLNVTMNDRYHPDDVLLSAGWVQITRSLLGIKEQNIFWEKFLTEYQKQFLLPYFEENDEPLSSTSKMKWEFERYSD
jgi:hypothetical protein